MHHGRNDVAALWLSAKVPPELPPVLHLSGQTVVTSGNDNESHLKLYKSAFLIAHTGKCNKTPLHTLVT